MPLTTLSVPLAQLPWLRSMAHRQASQPYKSIPCGPSLEAVSIHLAPFEKEWTTALRSISQQCPTAT